ncbi:MAG: adenosylcobinamide-GDP ribazoletransferase [Tissierellales bacterium]|nr:adenosylcobinamide-GDP ribazoletransferase [Tissierellales bacterium]MBN2827641.1 adenosylcobinamide-GDP ribazoletransferase [Tissierellales bacterium]
MKKNLLQIIKSFTMMLLFFTRIPIKHHFEFDEYDYDIGLMFFSLIGLVIGLGLMAMKWITLNANPYVSALMILLLYVWMTGGIHIDGLSDTVDGVFSGRERERIFEIMKDSRVGAFGSISISLLLISYVILFAEHTAGTILLMPVVGKSAVLASASISDYAKKESGLGTRFIEQSGDRERYIGFAVTAILCLIVNVNLIIAAAATFVFCGLVTQYMKKKLGGMTGDTLGFINETAQIFFMLVVSLVL